ncbi:hypothetical protein GSI_15016 [Ganoderma sinense ZZ0214-1]|uniref:Uncharacterized protein n=1 Tax=Ganoderma sinense ZZ0214-1 TaxID=1077348 RepID=A0A2G8RLZ3_9APHY|nr:hypothetical protein GSI_15016 [Ganoderma sinense ZZ0214-1]
MPSTSARLSCCWRVIAPFASVYKSVLAASGSSYCSSNLRFSSAFFTARAATSLLREGLDSCSSPSSSSPSSSSSLSSSPPSSLSISYGSPLESSPSAGWEEDAPVMKRWRMESSNCSSSHSNRSSELTGSFVRSSSSSGLAGVVRLMVKKSSSSMLGEFDDDGSPPPSRPRIDSGEAVEWYMSFVQSRRLRVCAVT